MRVVLTLSLSVVVMITLLGGAAPLSAQPGAIEVTTLEDAVDADGECSIREAIENVNDEAQTHDDCAEPGVETTIVLPAGAIDLTGVLHIAAGTVTIEGPGADLTTLDGNAVDRIFLIYTPGAVVLRDFRMTRGAAPGSGGAISHEDGDLTLERVQITRSSAATSAGAIHSAPASVVTVTISDSMISGNAADLTGAIYLDGDTAPGSTLVIVDSRITDNDGGGAAVGGRGVDITVAATLFEGNEGEFGGAIWLSDGNLEVSDSVFRANISDGDAGAIALDGGSLSVVRTLFEGNRGDVSGGGEGGAIVVWGSGGGDTNATVTESMFIENFANGGGAIALNAVSGNVFAEIERSSFVRNGAEYGSAVSVVQGATAGISNSTFDENGSPHSTIFVAGALSAVMIEHVTIVGAELDPEDVFYAGAALLTVDSPATGNVRNSVIVRGMGDACGGDGLLDGGGNADDDGTCPGAVATSLEELGELTEDEDTLLLSRLPERRTALVDGGDPLFCLDEDQLEHPRPVGAGCDIGAREHPAPYQAFAPMLARDP